MRGAACLACRRRKSRCKLESGSSSSCLMCRSHGTPCEFPRNSRQNRPGTATSARCLSSPPQSEHPTTVPTRSPYGSPSNDKQDRLAGCSSDIPVVTPPVSLGRSNVRTSQTLDVLEDSSNNQRLLGPVLDSDSQVLSDIVADGFGGPRIARTLWTSNASGLSAPVVFTETRRRPVGVNSDLNPARAKLEIIEKFLDPYIPRLVELFMTKANPCLPLFNQQNFLQHHEDPNLKKRISPSLLACLYAHSLAFWSSDPFLSSQRRPDQRFVWNLASEALYSELRLCPSIHTISAILLNVGGRPTTLVFNNAGQLGFAISMAFTLGLNRDPSGWDIPDDEKHIRMKTWWALMIHDRWSSLAYGIPPRIQDCHTDVPAPTLHLLTHMNSSIEDQQAASVFVALRSLTDLLSNYLEVINQVHQPLSSQSNLSSRLSAWIESTGGDLRRIVLRGSDLRFPGAANLRLAFLSIQFLDSRINLEILRGTTVNTKDEILMNQYLHTRRRAEEIVLFVQELGQPQLKDFWLPEAAFYLSSVMSFLTRSAIELEDTASDLSGNGALSLAGDLMISLGLHKEAGGWDIGDLCLTQYSDILDHIQRRQFDASFGGLDLEALEALVSDSAFQDNMVFPQI